MASTFCRLALVLRRGLSYGVILILLKTSLLTGVRAGAAEVDADPKKPQIDIAAEDLVILQDDKDAPLVQKFSLSGEFQTQWASGTSDRGGYGSRDFNPNDLWGDIEVRRFRLGFDARLLERLKLWGSFTVNPDVNPVYRDLYEMALTVRINDAANLGFGKIKTRYFSQEWNTRTRELITFEQSLLVNSLIPRQLTGVWFFGKKDDWVYDLVGYAGDYQTEFSRFNAGAVIQAGFGYDFATVLDVDKAVLKLDYQGSTSSENSDGPGKFANAVSVNTTFQNGRLYGFTDLLAATGRGAQGDVWGVTLTPTYFLIENRLQFILRYQYAHGDHSGLKLQNRYEALASDIIDTKGIGEEYSAVYLGLNYYVHRHNLKLMTAVEYHDMRGGPKDFSGWTYLAGVRLAF